MFVDAPRRLIPVCPPTWNMLYGGMAKKRNRPKRVPAKTDDDCYEAVLAGVIELLESARHAAARSVNSIMTATYWEIGHRIVEEEQRGKHRAGYGEQLVTRMSEDLTRRCGRGFGYRNLYQMRQLYLAYPRILADSVCKIRAWRNGAGRTGQKLSAFLVPLCPLDVGQKARGALIL